MANEREAKSSKTSPAAAPGDQPDSKLKILALHGYRQNGDGFKSKLGSFRKFINKYAELVFVTAPHIAPPLADSEPGTEPDPAQRSWWFNKDDGTFKGTNKQGPAIGFEESLRLVEKVWREEQCCGLLGFSQGACFVGLLCDLSARGMTSIKPQFAVLSSGFRSGMLVPGPCYEHKFPGLVHISFYGTRVEIPSLHIYGKADEVIPNEMSMALADTFIDPQVLTHPGGHFLPAQAAQKQTYEEFFRERLQFHLEAKEIVAGSGGGNGVHEEDDDDSD